MNYKHLHYFLMVAEEGSIARACKRLHLTPQTISGQLSLLEGQLGVSLFERTGRNLKLTETGRMVKHYAQEIFSLGGELEDLLRNLPNKQLRPFKVGVVEAIPQAVVYRLLAPTLQLLDSMRLVCRKGSVDALLADLAAHKIDLAIVDAPLAQGKLVRASDHLLGECGVTFFATASLANKLGKGFPECLDYAPLLIPSEVMPLQSRLLQWFDKRHIRPQIVGEFDDTALMKRFGRDGGGLFVAPTPIAAEVEREYGVVKVGQTDEVVERFHAVSVERKSAHPAITTIIEGAQQWLKPT